MLEFISKNADTILTIVATILTALWGLFKGTETYQKWVNDKYWQWMAKAGEVAAATVDKTYREKVRGMKRGKGSRKLGLKEIEEVNEFAWVAFQEEAKARGLSMLNVTKSLALSLIQDKLAEKKESK